MDEASEFERMGYERGIEHERKRCLIICEKAKAAAQETCRNDPPWIWACDYVADLIRKGSNQ